MGTLREICFMVMPYGTKRTDATPGQGPTEINFDALWDRALRPAIEALGYDPVRADQDIGALIIHEMLERLYFSDLVLAEMTIPNGNVYYEVGIRHACKSTGCVLLAADWSRQLFDVAQMRTVRYPLAAAEVDDAAAAQIQKVIVDRIKPLIKGTSPMNEVLPGFPSAVDPARASVMRKHLQALMDFQGRMSSIRAAPQAEREQQITALMAEYQTIPAPVAHGLLKLFEQLGAWQQILALVTRLPADLAAQPNVVELVNLAKSKLGNHTEAIGALQALIATSGATSEREGLLGGRYKRLYAQAATPADKLRYLNAAIDHYERGMMLDLNDYYPSSNLPRLYRTRGLKSDAAKAQTVAQLVVFACQRAKQRGANDEWLRPTLLGAAFDAGDVDGAETLYGEIVQEGAAAWKLQTTVADLEISLQHVTDDARRADLQSLLVRLNQLL
jgi:hypothetical protein